MDDVQSPSIFQARYLRSGARFSNLKRHLFLASEKEWLCDRLLSLLGGEQRSGICNIYGIPLLVVNEWIDAFRLGLQLSDGYCVPDDSPVDSVAIAAILNYEFDRLCDETVDQKTERLMEFFRIQLSETNTRRHNALNIQASQSMRIVYY